MTNLAYYVAALIAVATAVLKVVRSGRPPYPEGVSYLCGAQICLGLSAATLAPATLRLGSLIEPIPNLTRLIGNSLAAAAVFGMLGVLAFAAHPPDTAHRRMRVHRYVLGVALIAMTVLLVSARTRFTVDFVNVYATRPAVVAYEAVFLAYATWGLIGVVLLVRQIADQAQDAFLRVGLRLLALGAVVGLGWSSWKLAVSILKATTGDPVPLEGEVSSLLSAVAVLLFAVGATLTAWGPQVAHPVLWLRVRRANRRIEPLWSALHAAMPELAFDYPGAGLEFRMYHRIVEIRDTSLALRVCFHPDAHRWASDDARSAGLTDTATAAVTEAASLAAALEAHRAGHRYHDNPSTAPTPHQLDADINAEARWLAKVSSAFTNSPIVEDVRGRVRAELRATYLNHPGLPSA
ncbi:MAG TPA: MAB_1171c family putative transporter [Pseudonocardiaceae bacterium]|nr:MAB_1171c family putative transporter [Pseudonocardiaceae bacterium]